MSFELFKKLRAITGKKIFVGHNPMPAAKEGISRKEALSYKRGLKVVNEEIYNPLGALLLNQPALTVMCDGYTDSVFTKGSKRLAIGKVDDDDFHPDTDTGHMNSDFGKEWLSNFIVNIHQADW